MLRISFRGKPRERLDGEPAQPLALALDPDVIVAVGKQDTAVAADRFPELALRERVGEREHVDPHHGSGTPPHGAGVDVDQLRLGRQRPAQVVEQLAQVGPGLCVARLRPQLARELVAEQAVPASEDQTRPQPLHPRSGELRHRPAVHHDRDLAEEADHQPRGGRIRRGAVVGRPSTCRRRRGHRGTERAVVIGTRRRRHRGNGSAAGPYRIEFRSLSSTPHPGAMRSDGPAPGARSAVGDVGRCSHGSTIAASLAGAFVRRSSAWSSRPRTRHEGRGARAGPRRRRNRAGWAEPPTGRADPNGYTARRRRATGFLASQRWTPHHIIRTRGPSLSWTVATPSPPIGSVSRSWACASASADHPEEKQS